VTLFYCFLSQINLFGLFACSGILFNRDSPLRPERFVTQKRPVRCDCGGEAGSVVFGED
jgi:GDP-D-mannose dehydratase